MKDDSTVFTVNGVNLSKIRNRNEQRVVKLMPSVLEDEFGDYIFDPLDIEDIYALALNLLPARYSQKGTIVFSGKLDDEDIRSKIWQATNRVLDNPTRFRKD